MRKVSMRWSILLTIFLVSCSSTLIGSRGPASSVEKFSCHEAIASFDEFAGVVSASRLGLKKEVAAIVDGEEYREILAPFYHPSEKENAAILIYLLEKKHGKEGLADRFYETMTCKL